MNLAGLNHFKLEEKGGELNRRYIFVITIIAALGGLMFGYDWVVIGGAEIFYEQYFKLSDPVEIGWAMSVALLGALIGVLCAGPLSDSLGRKWVLSLSGLMFILTSVGTGLAGSFEVFTFNRLIGGIAIGITSSISPIYIAEIAPASMRGQLVSINQLTIALGVMAAQAANWLIAGRAMSALTHSVLQQDSWNVQFGWRWMFGAAAIPASVFFSAVLFVPESPRWLVKKGRSQNARAFLKDIGGASYAEQSLAEIESALKGEIARSRLGEFLNLRMLRVLLLGIFLAVLQQWCGINVIFQYGSRIFAEAGYPISGILFNILITGVTAVALTCVAIYTVDRWGRRALMLSGTLCLGLVHLATGFAYFRHMTGALLVVLIVAAIACYSYSLAPVTWVILSEIFPNRIRGSATSLSVAALWIANFTLAQTFPMLLERIGLALCFWLYSAVCVLGFLVIINLLPETKGKSLEEIERELL